jgi:hypothetical protein
MNPEKLARGTFRHYGLQQWLVASYVRSRSSFVPFVYVSSFFFFNKLLFINKQKKVLSEFVFESSYGTKRKNIIINYIF